MTISELENKLAPYFEEGWRPIIRCQDGWADLVNEVHEEIVKVDPDYKIHQIKQKFGGLRYYAVVLGDSAYSLSFVRDADKRSCEICEECGGKGCLCRGPRGWLQSLCKDCFAKLPTSEKSVYDFNAYMQKKRDEDQL